MAASLNDGLTALAREYPDKFSCMATAPLQAPEAAADELARAKANGHLGVMIASNVAGKNLDDPGLDVFWAKAEALDMPVFVHPTNVLGSDDRLKDFYLRNFIGNPLDTTIAVACLIFGGVMDRFPGLRFLSLPRGRLRALDSGPLAARLRRAAENPRCMAPKTPSSISIVFTTTPSSTTRIVLSSRRRHWGRSGFCTARIIRRTWAITSPARDIPGLNRLSESDQEMILTG